MRLTKICTLILGLTIFFSASYVMADNMSPFASQPKAKPSAISSAVRQIDNGAKKLVQGTIDVITLKPLWAKPALERPVDPWMRHTQKKTEKKSFWSSWFGGKEEPKRSPTVGEWVGMKRPT